MGATRLRSESLEKEKEEELCDVGAMRHTRSGIYTEEVEESRGSALPPGRRLQRGDADAAAYAAQSAAYAEADAVVCEGDAAVTVWPPWGEAKKICLEKTKNRIGY
jgi:hypothetical protein